MLVAHCAEWHRPQVLQAAGEYQPQALYSDLQYRGFF